MAEVKVPKQKLIVAGIMPHDFGSLTKYLMVKSEDGLWGWPGGTIEVHEDISDALPREYLEETGVQVVPKSVVDIAFMKSPGGNHLFRVIYQVAYVEGNAKPGDEIEEIGYFSLGELRAISSDMLRGRESIIRPLEKMLRGEKYPLSIVSRY